jgi:Cu/Ag efflux protein CusF
MDKHLARVLLCTALLIPVLAPGWAVAADKPKNAFNQEKKNDLSYDGSITAIDVTAKTVTIKQKQKGALTFSVPADAILFVKHKKGAASLSDFKVGEDVNVLYQQNGNLLACRSMWQPGSNPSEKEHKVQKQK